MQLTEEQLKQIIKEELEATLNEGSLGDLRRQASKDVGDAIKKMDHYINMQPDLVNISDVESLIGSWERKNEVSLRGFDIEDVANILMNHSEYDSVVEFLDFVMRRR